MTIAYSPYELVARANGRRRAGVLLRVTFDDGIRGYADVHPWPELGDAPLEHQLAALAEDYPEPLTECSLRLARADGEARATDRSLFEGLTVPPSHASLPYGFTADDLARIAAEGYGRVKLKGWGFSSDELALFRSSGLRFRLDFNARLSAPEVHRLLDGWSDLSWIDWLEDPCPYAPTAWKALQSRVRLAIDFEPGDSAYDVRVVKPARDLPFLSLTGEKGPGMESQPAPCLSHSPFTIHPPPRLAFTSYLDHPVGQLGAAWTAARALADGLPLEPGGLITHEVYEPTEFSRQLGTKEARLIPPDGPGIGFGRELDRLGWRTLKE